MEIFQRRQLPKRVRLGYTWTYVKGIPHEMVGTFVIVAGVVLIHCRYHWSVEYFEDLRNVNHCEFIVMKRNENNGRYILQNELRTWSELKRRAAKEGTPTSATATSSRPNPLSSAGQAGLNSSPTIPARRWGGCVNGCNHDKVNYPRRPMRKNTMEYQASSQQLPPPATAPMESVESEREDQEATHDEADHTPTINEPTPGKLSRKHSTTKTTLNLPPTPASPNDASNDASSSEADEASSSITRQHPQPRTAAILRHLQPLQKTPGEGFSDDSDYFPGMQHIHHSTNGHRKLLRASSKQRQQSKERKLARRQTEQSWKQESGMGTGARTDRLGDGDATSDEAGLARKSAEEERVREGEGEDEGEILPEALKGDMVVEKGEGDRGRVGEGKEGLPEEEVERLKEESRKGFGEVY